MNKLEGIFTLRSPLSHIGEYISIGSYLVHEPIIQPDGTTEEIFVYSGNAWRGQLRDMSSIYMLKRYGEKVKLDSFHLLFSGGKIGGDQKINIGKIKALRESVPVIGLFGGCVNNALLPGMMRVGNCYPLCVEARPAFPDDLSDRCTIPYSTMTFEKEYSRKDDSKNNTITEEFLSTITEEDKREGPADQMRMSIELVATGVQLRTYIHFLSDDELYLGVILSALSVFSDSPFIGGQANKGYGKVDLDYQLNGDDFVRITDKGLKLSSEASRILENYNQYLDQHRDEALQELG